MLWLCLFIITVLFSNLQANEVISLPKNLQNISERDLRQIIENAIETRCIKNANENALVELKDSLFKFRCCMLENVRIPINNKSDKTNTLDLLNTKSNAVYKCLETLIKKAEICLNLEEKYLAELFLNAHNATVDQLSQDNGKNLEAAINAFQSANCSPPIRHLPEKLFVTCAPKLNHLKALSVSNYVLKPHDFCYDLIIVYECIINSTKLQCNNDENVVENIKELFKYFVNFCQNDVIIANNETITQVIFD